jgi:hypothetical protein
MYGVKNLKIVRQDRTCSHFYMAGSLPEVQPHREPWKQLVRPPGDRKPCITRSRRRKGRCEFSDVDAMSSNRKPDCIATEDAHHRQSEGCVQRSSRALVKQVSTLTSSVLRRAHCTLRELVLSQTRFLIVYTSELALAGCCGINGLALPL